MVTMLDLTRNSPTTEAASQSHHAANHHLQRAQAEHQAAQRPQPLQRKLQPEHEQQEDHAQRGQALDAFDVLNAQR
jgi:hypothetical protein